MFVLACALVVHSFISVHYLRGVRTSRVPTRRIAVIGDKRRLRRKKTTRTLLLPSSLVVSLLNTSAFRYLYEQACWNEQPVTLSTLGQTLEHSSQGKQNLNFG